MNRHDTLFLPRVGKLAWLVGWCLAAAASSAAAERAKVVAYVPNWVDLNAFAKTIDYARLTHINLAFENPKNDDGEVSFNPDDTAVVTAAHAHGVKVLVSIGGGSAAEDRVLQPRYFRLIAPGRRGEFAAKLAQYVVAHGFDGLDVDIEGPSINGDFGGFVHELARVLHRQHKLLTAALSQGYGGAKVPAAALADLDFVNIMAYDGAGYWEPDKPGPHSSLEFARSNVAYWLGRGLPKGKAVLGVPFYGYGFGKAFRKRDFAYKDLVATYPGAEDRDQSGETIWYNGRPTIRAKAEFVRDEGLAGMMIWSLDYDVPGPNSLLMVMDEGLRTTETKIKQ